MTPQDRENLRYSLGGDNPIPIEIAEQAMFSLLPFVKGKLGMGRLLDIGCGKGIVAERLQKKGFKVYGVDFSSIAIQKARQRNVDAKECDVDKDGLPYDCDYFDVIWAGDILEHVFDPIFLLKEISRVLKFTGNALISVPNSMNWFNRIYLFITGKSPQSNIYRTLNICKHHTFFSLELMEYMLKEADLTPNKIGAIIKVPKVGNVRYSDNKFICSLFGLTLILRANKK